MLQITVDHQNTPIARIVTDNANDEVRSITDALTTAALTDATNRWANAQTGGTSLQKVMQVAVAEYAAFADAFTDQAAEEDPGDLADELTAAAADLTALVSGRGGVSA